MSTIYLKSYHGVLEFQVDDKEQKLAMLTLVMFYSIAA